MKIIDTLIADAVNLIHKQYTGNKPKLDEMSSGLFNVFLDKVKPYFILLTVILLVIILLQIVQFYYYIRLFIKQVNPANRIDVVKEIMKTW
jgi:hypothetical protein